jgi:hypothetical protein
MPPIPTSFDLNSFQGASFEGAGDTRRLRIEPKEYPAIVVGPFGEQGRTRLRTEKQYLILDIVWQPDDEAQKAALGLEKLPTVRQSLFLDLTPQGGLDMGPFKNGDLNRLREIWNLNDPQKPWKFADFVGRPARIKVEHRPNEKDPANPFTNVTAVSKL